MPLLIALLLSTSLATLPAKVEAYLAPLVKGHDFNGVVLVGRGDKLTVQKTYGMANWELNAPLSARARFRIASITKTFTAAAVTLLAERGKLSYGDPLSKFIPDFPNGEKITVRHLLLHRSGVGNPRSEFCSDATLDDLVKEIAAKQLAFEPGTQSSYSNGGYALLARVIERASGKSWQDFISDEIFKPLSLVDTRVDSQAAIVPMRVSGYIPGPGALGVLNASCAGAWAAIGSGAVLSSAPDLFRWARAVRNERLFHRSALEYPYGWGVRKYFDRNVIEQSGIVNGASSYVAAYLDDDLYVVVLSNLQSGALTSIGKGLAALALGKEPPKLTASPAAVESTPEQRAQWIGRFVNPNIATVRITERDDALIMRWCESCESVYLTPTGPLAAYDRQDSVSLQLAPDRSIAMKWPEGEPQKFTRAVDDAPADIWGGEHAEMQVMKAGAQLEFDCGKGTITETLAADSQGHFRVKGTFTPEHGGPVRQSEASQSMDATYAGDINGDTMTLQLIVADKELTLFTLKRRQRGTLRKCF